MASKINKGEILAKFFDDGEYTALFADGAVSAACGYAAGQQAYAVYQNGEAVTVKDVDKWGAIEKLADRLQINKEEIMAIGDNMNDKRMVENADFFSSESETDSFKNTNIGKCV